MLCKYKHVFGKEKEGVHSIRVFNIAVMDVIFTILAGMGLSAIFHWNLLYTLITLFVVAIIFHRLFCVNTTVNKLIFGDVSS